MEDRISQLKNKFWHNPLRAEQRKRVKKVYMTLWHSIKRTNIRIIRIPEGEEIEKGAESLFKEIIPENFPNLKKNLSIQVHKGNTSLYHLNAKKKYSTAHFNQTGKNSR